MVSKLGLPIAGAIFLVACGQQSNQATSSQTGSQPTGVRVAMAAGPVSAPAPAADPNSPNTAPYASGPVSADLPNDADQRANPPANEPSNAQYAGPTVPAGTHLRVRLQETLDTKYCRPGEAFTAVLEEPVVVGRRVVIPRGAAVRGHVTSSQQSGRLKGRAYLGLVLDSVQVDGRSYAIATNFTARASSSHKKRNLAIIGGGTGGGAAIGAIAGGGVGAAIGAGVGAGAGTVGAFFTGRKQVVLPVETELLFSLRRPVTVRG